MICLEKKKFKNDSDKQQVYHQAVLQTAEAVRIFPSEVSAWLIDNGYPGGVRKASYYLPKVKRLKQEKIGNRYCYTCV